MASVNYIYEPYRLKIYTSEDNELIGTAKIIGMFWEAKNYNAKGEFQGYNLFMYTRGEYILLNTYNHEENMVTDRIRIETALRLKETEMYLMEG